MLSRFDYLRDPVGNPLAELWTGSLASVTVYGYDANDRLTSACRPEIRVFGPPLSGPGRM